MCDENYRVLIVRKRVRALYAPATVPIVPPVICSAQVKRLQYVAASKSALKIQISSRFYIRSTAATIIFSGRRLQNPTRTTYAYQVLDYNNIADHVYVW